VSQKTIAGLTLLVAVAALGLQYWQIQIARNS
jgi:hypothetical protein